MEKKVKDQSNDILILNHKVAEQADKIQQLEEKLENVQDVVYQLLGGLFSHNSQSGRLNGHIDKLFGRNNIDDKKYTNTSKWAQYPTTRQGDSNENRIDALEAQIAAAGELLYNMTKKEIEVYEPTRSPFCDFKYYAEDDDDEDAYIDLYGAMIDEVEEENEDEDDYVELNVVLIDGVEHYYDDEKNLYNDQQIIIGTFDPATKDISYFEEK